MFSAAYEVFNLLVISCYLIFFVAELLNLIISFSSHFITNKINVM